MPSGDRAIAERRGPDLFRRTDLCLPMWHERTAVETISQFSIFLNCFNPLTRETGTLPMRAIVGAREYLCSARLVVA
jgi:hypothetical protein